MTLYRRLGQPSVPATLHNGASSEVNLRSPVRPSPCPARPDGSGLPWTSPHCFRMLRCLALAGVRDLPGHWREHDYESRSLKLVQHRVANLPPNRTGTLSRHPALQFSRLFPCRLSASHLPARLLPGLTWPPSPCRRLSRLLTTTPYPPLPRGIGVSLGSPLPTSHPP